MDLHVEQHDRAKPFFSCVGFASAANWPVGTCGKRPLVSAADEDKIVGGTQAIPGDWPWSVSVARSMLCEQRVHDRSEERRVGKEC